MKKLNVSLAVAMFIMTASTLLAQSGYLPLTGGTLTGPLTGPSINTTINAGSYSGSDIGAQINNAIAALPGGCGTVTVPLGVYTYSTTIVKPQCVNIIGQGGTKTTSQSGSALVWNSTSGAAMVIGDTLGAYAGISGTVQDIQLLGQGYTGNAIGIYCGGDPAGVISPTNYICTHQNLIRVQVTGFQSGIEYGGDAFSDNCFGCIFNANNVAVSYSTGVSNSGEGLVFVGSQFLNNYTAGFYLANFGDINVIGGQCDYNPECVHLQGATSISFIGSHIEQLNGPLFDVLPGNDQRLLLNITNSTLVLSAPTGTDAEMIFVASGAYASLKIDGGLATSAHNLTNIINWNATNDASLQEVSGLQAIGLTGAITSFCGPNCLIHSSAGLQIGSGVALTNSSSLAQVGTPTAGRAACIKSEGPPAVIGYCSTVVGSSGTCTCN